MFLLKGYGLKIRTKRQEYIEIRQTLRLLLLKFNNVSCFLGNFKI